MMKKKSFKNLICDNKGETLVEVIVAFMVLLIVLALFTGAINAASASVNNSIDIRRTTDSEYSALCEMRNQEDTDSSKAPGSNGTGVTASENVQGTKEVAGVKEQITLTAYQYQSGDTVYWVYR